MATTKSRVSGSKKVIKSGGEEAEKEKVIARVIENELTETKGPSSFTHARYARKNYLRNLIDGTVK